MGNMDQAELMALEIAWEKLSNAVALMAKSTASLQERLESAYNTFFTISGPSAATRHLPEDLQPEYDAIERELTKVSAQGNEGTLIATLRVMSDDEAKQLIERIVMLYEGVARRFGPAD